MINKEGLCTLHICLFKRLINRLISMHLYNNSECPAFWLNQSSRFLHEILNWNSGILSFQDEWNKQEIEFDSKAGMTRTALDKEPEREQTGLTLAGLAVLLELLTCGTLTVEAADSVTAQSFTASVGLFTLVHVWQWERTHTHYSLKYRCRSITDYTWTIVSMCLQMLYERIHTDQLWNFTSPQLTGLFAKSSIILQNIYIYCMLSSENLQI